MTTIKTTDTPLTIAPTLGGDIRIGIGNTYAVLTVKQAERVCVVVTRQVDKLKKDKTKSK